MVRQALIVDDSDTDQLVVCTFLEALGFGALSASTIADGYELALATEPDVIFLDLLLSHEDGFQFLLRLKKMEKLREIPIIILSSIGDMDTIFKSIENGASDYLIKPVYRETLLKKLTGLGLYGSKA